MSKRLFVGGLAWATDDDGLRAAFASFGQVTDAKVILDRDSGRSRGFGFVTFENDGEADAAISGMDGSQLDGRSIRVNEAGERERRGPGGPGGGGRDRRPPRGGDRPREGGKSGNRLFVGGLAWATDDNGLRTAFASFGNVTDAKVIQDRESGRSRGFGFVTFETQEEAAAAIGAMDGSKLDGRTIRVDEFAGRFGSQPSEPDRRPAAKGFFARLFGKD